MPVILRSNRVAEWLNNHNTTFESLKSSIVSGETYPDGIEYQAVNPVVNNARNDTPSCLQSYTEYRKEGQGYFFANRSNKKPRFDK